MTDLTEQFNNDEIDESKLYYFKQKMSEEIEIGHPFSLNMVRAMDDIYLEWFLIDKVLSPVPSYEEWQKLLSEYDAECRRSDELEDSYWKEVEKNKKLKELLKECESSIQYYQETYGAMDLDTYTLLAKLKEVLK